MFAATHNSCLAAPLEAVTWFGNVQAPAPGGPHRVTIGTFRELETVGKVPSGEAYHAASLGGFDSRAGTARPRHSRAVWGPARTFVSR